ncbi:MAG: hypothetical protein NTY24_04120, partial [Mycobacterium sp.]|nr:hypothetical protein [Mycobacterium sp.]
TAHASGVAPGIPGPDPDEGVVTTPAEATAADAITGTGADGAATTTPAVTEFCGAPSVPARDAPDPASWSTRSSNPLSTKIVGAFFAVGETAGASLSFAVADARGTVRPLVVDCERFAVVPVFAESVRGARLSRER